MTAGLTSAPACVRIIIRDVAGKHSWDSAVLYGPPSCSPNSPTHNCLSHTQSPHSANLHLRTPPRGLPKKMGLDREDSEEERQEERQAEAGRRGTKGERQGFLSEVEDGEERKVNEEEKGDHRGGEEGDEEEEEEEKNENSMERVSDKVESGLENLLAPPLAKRVCREAVPAWESLTEGDDALDEMLQYLGYASPECLQRAGTQTKGALTLDPVASCRA